jgi:hypothetical protein
LLTDSITIPELSLVIEGKGATERTLIVWQDDAMGRIKRQIFEKARFIDYKFNMLYNILMLKFS